jgi:Short C-terminal domain
VARVSLLHRGRTASAVATILSVHDPKFNLAGNPYGDGGRSPVGEKIRVRVRPDGQPAFESEAHVRSGSSFPLEGHDTYVLFDPESPDHCEIDYERLSTEFGETSLASFPPSASDDGAKGGAGSGTSTEQSEPAPEAAPDEMVDGLAKLGVLHANGTLTDEEFTAAKARLLAPDGS